MWSDQFVEDFDPASTHAFGGSGYESHTGDPRQDIEYERQYHQTQSTFIVPNDIKNFLSFFRKCINEQNVYEIQNMYEIEFNKLTDRFFKTNPWPDAEVVAPIIQNDRVFLILYKELYYRHIYARVQSGPTQEQRLESYYNYCDLFNYILNADGPVRLELPNQWLWDIIDEFIYQFQSFSIYRCKISKKPADEIDVLRANPKIWNVHSVLNVLHSLVEKSSINRQLEVYTSGGDPDSVAGEFGQQSLYKMLGYFSLIGLLRLHSLLGDYYQALKVLENIDFNKKNMYSRVPACQITTFYYVGFAYMMMRRYQDAIRTFSNILLDIQRTKQMFQTKAQLYDQITKMNDKMYNLLAICLVLHPIRIDESVHSHLREKFADKMLRMQKADLSEFEQNFSFACPKFLSPVPPNYEAQMMNFHKEPFLLQLKVFLDEVAQQILIPTIRSYLKLYTTLPISKLAIFMDMTEDELKQHLMCFKHKMKNVVWTKGTSGLEGEFQSASEVDFYIDKMPYGRCLLTCDWLLIGYPLTLSTSLVRLTVTDMVHIADTKVARRYGDFFIRQIHKFEEITRGLKGIYS